MKKNVFNKKKINPDEYVNIHTGEILSTEIPNITSVNKRSDRFKLIDSKDYLIIDSETMSFISKMFNKTDMARIYELCHMVKGNYNMLYHEETKSPHTTKTLQLEMDYSVNKFKDFLLRLFKENVIAMMQTYKGGKLCTYLILNPYLARKAKLFDEKNCLDKFEDFMLKFNDFKGLNKNKQMPRIKEEDFVFENLDDVY